MRRSVVLVLVFGLAALAAGAAVLTLSSRPDLEQARTRVERSWAGLRDPLDTRYAALAAGATAARDRLGADRPLLEEVSRAVTAWTSSHEEGVEAQVAASNRLEGLAARLRTFVAATPRLRSSDAVARALEAAEEASLEGPRRAYNEAVASYEALRGGFPRRLVAGALGFDARLTVEVPT